MKQIEELKEMQEVKEIEGSKEEHVSLAATGDLDRPT